MCVTAGVIEKRTSVGAYKLFAPNKKGEEKQVYFSSENRAAMLTLFGSESLRCPVISSQRGDVLRQLMEAVRHPDIAIEVGRSGEIEAKTLEEKREFWENGGCAERFIE
ncbi:MAG: hypothetical protein WC435_04020 [Candidatus Paceibacterota bacterium]